MILRGALPAFALALPAAAQPVSGLYLAGGAGLNHLVASAGEVRSPILALLRPDADSRRSELRWDAGWAGVASLGYGFGGHGLGGLRAEVEISARDNALDRARILGASATETGGRARSLGGMGNVLLDFEPRDLPVSPYLGAGIGYVRHRYDGVRGRLGPLVGEVDGTDGRFAYQAIAGLSFYPGPPGLALTVEYRFLGTLLPEYELRVGSAATGAPVATGRLEAGNFNNAVLIGLRYAFQ